ncbi:MAG TPA: tetratricopeptide repeat protein [Terriglobales bacterium]|nr:tetratricopeptide repeat protein [Terriglobales bacterium]
MTVQKQFVMARLKLRPFGKVYMRNPNHIHSLLAAGLLAAALVFIPLPSGAANKDMVQLQTQVQALQDQVARMQQSMDMNMGAMRNLIEQSADSVNKMNATVTDLQNHLQGMNADNGGKIDQLSGQVQSLHDSVDELKSRLAKVSKQLDQMQQGGQNLAPGQPGMAAGPGGGAPPAGEAPDNNAAASAPPPDQLYNNALRDYNSGKYDLSSQEFSDYMKYYSNTDLAGNAQFYLADIEYRQGNFAAAAKDYDKVLEQYPGGSKAAAAQLKKGYALLELGQRDAGVRELNSLIARYPRSIEASQARDRLRRLGVTSSNTVHRPPSNSQR